MGLLRTLFPPKCIVCRQVVPEGCVGGVCAVCRDRLDRLYNPHKLFFDSGIAGCIVLFDYDDEMIKSMLLRLKRHAPPGLVKVIAEYYARAAAEEQLEYERITFVPRRKRAIKESGFDQARLIAYELSLISQKSFACSLNTLRSSKRQHSLKGAERIANVRGLYGANGIQPGSFLLLDDIVTTGATASAAAKALRNGGAEKVFVMAFAH